MSLGRAVCAHRQRIENRKILCVWMKFQALEPQIGGVLYLRFDISIATNINRSEPQQP